jgi:hypothetical protein
MKLPRLLEDLGQSFSFLALKSPYFGGFSGE